MPTPSTLRALVALALALPTAALADDPPAPVDPAPVPRPEAPPTPIIPAPPPPPAPPLAVSAAPPAPEVEDLERLPPERHRRFVYAHLGAIRTSGSWADAVYDTDGTGIVGVGAGLELNDHFAVGAEYGVTAAGATNGFDDVDTLRARYVGHFVGLSGRAQLATDHDAFPYVRIGVGAAISAGALDDGGRLDDRKIGAIGAGLSGTAVLGAEWMLPVRGAVRPTIAGEFGYGTVFEHALTVPDGAGGRAPIGRLSMGDVLGRLTIGARF